MFVGYLKRQILYVENNNTIITAYQLKNMDSCPIQIKKIVTNGKQTTKDMQNIK